MVEPSGSVALNEQMIDGIPAGTWEVDPEHSSVEFEVRNFGFVTVTGYFGEFEGTVVADGGGVRAQGSARTKSITTRVPERDEDLRSEAFLAAERFPEVRFEATRFESRGDGALGVVGQLTMKGREREVGFEASLGGPFTDHRGNDRLAIDLRSTVNRLEFGVDWDEEGPGGAKMASHDVDLVLHLGMRRIGGGPS